VETYQGQPLFADLDRLARAFGFVFFDLLAPNIVGRAVSPVTLNVPQQVSIFRWPSRQLFEGHFLWLRDPIASNASYSLEQVLKLVSFAELYGQVEYAFELLWWARGQLAGSDPAAAADIAEIIEHSRAAYAAVFPDLMGIAHD
jgi:hypothetical protein